MSTTAEAVPDAPATPDPDELLKVKDAAKIMKFGLSFVRQECDAGRLPHLRIGPQRQYRIRRADLAKYLEQSAVTPVPSGHATTPGTARGES